MDLTLYHGSKINHQFKSDLAMTFLTTDLDFTNNTLYGGTNGYKYQVEVTINKLFDSTNCRDIEKLYAAGYKLSDPYLNIEDNIDGHDEFGYDDEYDLYEGFGYEEKDVYKTASSFCNSKTIKNNTWETIEESDGVLDWISKNYDAILLLERGIKNYLILKKDNIKKVNLIK